MYIESRDQGTPTLLGDFPMLAACFLCWLMQEAEFVGSTVKQRKAGEVFAHEPKQSPPPRAPPTIMRPPGESDCHGNKS